MTIVLPVALRVVWEPERWKTTEDWVKATLAGIAALLVIVAVWMPHFYYLRLTSKGLTFQAVANRQFFAWNEICNVGIINRFLSFLPLGRSIVFTLRDDSHQRTTFHRVVNAVLSYDVSILTMFDKSSPEIIDLLEEWQNRYGRNNSHRAILGNFH
jgi:hypothetical protein